MPAQIGQDAVEQRESRSIAVRDRQHVGLAHDRCQPLRRGRAGAGAGLPQQGFVEQRFRFAVAAERNVYVAERLQEIRTQRRRDRGVLARASGRFAHERLGRRALVGGQIGFCRIENLHQKIAHGIRPRRFLARHVGLPQRDPERGQHRHSQNRGDGHAAAMALDEFARPIPARRRMRENRAATEITLDVFGERARRRVAALRIGFERFEQDIVQVAAQQTTQALRRRSGRRDCRRIAFVREGVRGRAPTDERGRTLRFAVGAEFGPEAEQQFVQQYAEAVDVGRGRDRAALRLLGRGIAGREKADRTRQDLAAVVDQLGDAEIEQFGFAAGGDKNIRRFDIAMHNQAAVRHLDGAAYVGEQTQTLRHIQIAFVRVARDGNAVDEFHDEKRNAGVGDAAVDQTRDMRMVEAGEHLAFALEQALLEFGIQSAAQYFDRHLLAKIHADALGEKHRGHAALAEFAHKTKAADLASDVVLGLQFGDGDAGVELRHRRIENAAVAVSGEQAAQGFAVVRRRDVLAHPRLALGGRQLNRDVKPIAQAVERVVGIDRKIRFGIVSLHSRLVSTRSSAALAAAFLHCHELQNTNPYSFVTSTQALIDERAGETPVAIDGAPGDAQRSGGFLQLQPGEVAQFHHARGARIGLLQLLQRLVQRECFFRAGDRQAVVAGRYGDSQPVAPGTLAQAVARVIDEKVAHRARGIREKLRGMGELEFASIADAQIQFVHQRRRVQRVAGALPRKLAAGHRLQARINGVEQCVRALRRRGGVFSRSGRRHRQLPRCVDERQSIIGTSVAAAKVSVCRAVRRIMDVNVVIG